MVAIREAPKAKEVPLPTTMKAAVLNSTGEAPVLTDDVAIPKLQGNQVLISLLASAVCHTDARLAAGDWTTYTTIETPKILGHQGVGKIIAGSLPNGFQMGERVGISWLNGQCAVCHLCISGHENLCSQLDPIGFRVNGTHAQFVIAEKNALVKIPDKVSSEMAAPIMCCGVTAYKAIKESKVRPGEILAIFGSGGTVGNLAIQYAEAMGIKTVAIDRGPVKMPHGAGTSITPIDITRAWPDVSSMIKKVCKQKSPQGALVLSHEHDFYSIALSCKSDL
jgi:propanol-preferring alcohol dehydrogenase